MPRNTELMDIDEELEGEEVQEEELEMTEEEKRELTRKYETDILGGLLAAASYQDDTSETATIKIARKGVTVLTFRIRPLSEQEYLDCRKRNTKYVNNKQLRTKVAESVDAARYRCELIYTATIEEDRDKVWNNKQAWRSLNVLNGIDLIEAVLKAGEKDAICDKLEEISGYNSTDSETAKN